MTNVIYTKISHLLYIKTIYYKNNILIIVFYNTFIITCYINISYYNMKYFLQKDIYKAFVVFSIASSVSTKETFNWL